MENNEFLHHLLLIKDILKKENVRLILAHPPYTQSQQKIIDTISKNSKKIIGQLERMERPTQEFGDELQRLIDIDKEPFVDNDKLQYIILGRVKPKLGEGAPAPETL